MSLSKETQTAMRTCNAVEAGLTNTLCSEEGTYVRDGVGRTRLPVIRSLRTVEAC